MVEKLKQTMNKPAGNKAVIIMLALICAVAFMIRTYYAFPHVFGDGFVNFLETDAWNRMLYAQKMAGMGFFESIGYMVNNNLLFSWIIATLGRGLPIEYVGAWLPPVMAVGAVIAVYFIGKNLFGTQAGLLSALFVAVIPSEFLNRSILGFADHHVLEVLLMALIILFIIKAYQSPRLINKYTVLAGAMIFLFFINNHSAIYTMLALFALFGLGFLVWNKFNKVRWYSSLPVLIIPMAIALIVYLPAGGWREFAFLFPQSTMREATTTQEIVSTVFQAPGQRTISELMPLLAPQGTFSLDVVITNLSMFTLSFIAGLYFLWRYRTNKLIVLLAIWTIAMLALTLNERRFLYYFTLNVGILSALACIEVAKLVKGKLMQSSFILALPLLVFALPFTQNIASNQAYRMPPEWHSALLWLKDQPNTGKVSAWVDYGHWIEYVTGKTANYLPGPGGSLYARLVMTQDEDEARKMLDAMDTGYLIMDRLTLARKYPALEEYAGLKQSNNSFGYLLYNRKIQPDFLKMEYLSANITIYRYLK